MEYKTLVATRYSVRRYKNEPVPDHLITELIDVMRFSVSAINLQPWRVRIVKDQLLKDQLFEATFGQNQVRSCSHLLVLCACIDVEELLGTIEQLLQDAPEARERAIGIARQMFARMTPEDIKHWAQNQVYIALTNLLNGAHALGLGACPMTAFDPAQFSRILKLPDTLVPTVLVSVGYPDEPQTPRRRLSVDQLLV